MNITLKICEHYRNCIKPSCAFNYHFPKQIRFDDMKGSCLSNEEYISFINNNQSWKNILTINFIPITEFQWRMFKSSQKRKHGSN